MMDPEYQDVFIAFMRMVEKAVAQNWALQGILDSSGVPNWRPLLEEVEAEILPDVHSQLPPLCDVIVGLPPLDSEDTAITNWREEIQKQIDRMLDHDENLGQH